MLAPVFIISLPRAGSTLLQRILMTNESISSVAEPWIMLPYVYSIREDGVLSEYGHHVCAKGINDFIVNLPDGKNTFYEELGVFITSLYEKQCKNGEKYFLDKTPRYYNIIPELSEIFPNAKFIFLFRNPMQIVSSMMNTWSSGTLRHLYANERDVNYGQFAISEGYEKIKERSCKLKYEELVNEPKKAIKEICDYLEIDYDENMLLGFSEQNTHGGLGDSVGSKKYKNITSETTEKWKKSFDSPYRKRTAINYINSLDDRVLEIQGYSKKDLIDEINSIVTTRKNSLNDRLDVLFGKCVRRFKLNILFGKVASKWAKNRYVA